MVAPSAPEVTQVRLTGVKLEWQIASDERVLSYQIRMRQGRETWEVIASAIPRQARFTEINTLQPGTEPLTRSPMFTRQDRVIFYA